MFIITFWNNSRNGHVGQTASMIATATMMAIEHNYKILAISTQLGDNDLRESYGVIESTGMKFLGLKESKVDSGIEGIMKLQRSGKLTGEQIQNYSKIVLRNRLEILTGKKLTSDEGNTQFNFNSYIDVIKTANEYYDMVFVDLDRGLNNEWTKAILSLSNIIVWNTEQCMKEIEKITELQREEKILSRKNVVYLLNKYDDNSKYNLKNIIRNSKIKKNIYTVPYDVMYSDILQDGKADQWFLNPKIRKASIEEEHGFFVSQINKFCDAIIYKSQELSML